MVYVYDKNNKSYEPCSNAMARKLLKENYAKIIKYNPFSIKLNIELNNAYNEIIKSDSPVKGENNG